MRRTSHLAIVTVVTASVGVVSCDGGPGGFAFKHGAWDDDEGNLSQRERPLGAQDPPSNSELPADRVPDTNESPPLRGGGGTGGATFVCFGIYECTLSGRSQSCTTTGN